jgi:hypothetical protein
VIAYRNRRAAISKSACRRAKADPCLGREATATLAYLLHLETTGRAKRLPGEVEHWRPILP